MSVINGTYNRWAARYGYDDGISDTLYGSSQNDVIHGYGGADTLYGGGGHDVIDGGRGNDMIIGGSGWDTLTGGAGHDKFLFGWGDSSSYWAGADVITDFNTNEDKIEFRYASPAGTSQNYTEFAVSGPIGSDQSEFNYMKNEAQLELNANHKLQFVFGTNGQDGYLFADLDHNGTIDTGIELKGLNSTGDFSHLNIF